MFFKDVPIRTSQLELRLSEGRRFQPFCKALKSEDIEHVFQKSQPFRHDLLASELLAVRLLIAVEF
jgi:hypothetical protein